ncbi:MAG: sugar ABC transporter permease [Clostridia bacterium]|nr:sugar ABC transporter permease [Clostridia bacterium]
MYYSSYRYGMDSGILIFALIAVGALIVIMTVAKWKLFQKAGEPGWKCLIPIYGDYVWFKLTWRVGAWVAILALSILAVLTATITVVAAILEIMLLILGIISIHKTSLSYGKGGGFTVGLIFLPFIFFLILAFGDSAYVGPEGIPVRGARAYGQEEKQIEAVEESKANHRLIWILTGIFLTAAVLFFVFELLYSLKNYSPIKGLSGSPFVGLKWYERLLQDSRFLPAILNSLIYGIVAVALAAAGGFAGMAMSRQGALRKIGIAAGLVLASVPRMFWESLFLHLDSPSLASMICGALPWVGLSVAAGALLPCRLGESGVRSALVVPVMRFITLFCGQNGVISVFHMAKDAGAMSVDYYLYARTMQNAQYSFGAAGYVFTALLNLVFAAIGVALLAVLLRRTGRKPLKQGADLIGAVPGIVVSILLIIGGILLTFSVKNLLSNTRVSQSLPRTLTEMIPASILGFGLFLLIQLLAGKNGAPGRFSWAFFAFALLALSQTWLSKYLLMRSVGLLNTVVPIALSWLLNPLALAFAAVLALSRPSTIGECVCNAVAAAMMAIVLGIGDLRASIYYIRNMDLSLLLYNSFASSSAAASEAISAENVRTALWGLTILICALPLGAGIALTCVTAGKE